MRRVILCSSLLLVGLLTYAFLCQLRVAASPLIRGAPGNYTVEQRLQQYGDVARKRWRPYFKKAKVPYPPKSFVLVGLKAENLLEVYAPNIEGDLQFVRSFSVCAASGTNGPKLKEGDRQVPEGVYRISFLNPSSAFHLSLRVNYPNDFDRQKGRLDDRTDLGGDIMIHGNCVSIGCLAMRDQAAEDLFVLAAEVGIHNSKVILAPFDFRTRTLTDLDFEGLPSWTPELYKLVQKEFDSLPTN